VAYFKYYHAFCLSWLEQKKIRIALYRWIVKCFVSHWCCVVVPGLPAERWVTIVEISDNHQLSVVFLFYLPLQAS
jgi:hypothetical protein